MGAGSGRAAGERGVATGDGEKGEPELTSRVSDNNCALSARRGVGLGLPTFERTNYFFHLVLFFSAATRGDFP